MTVCHNDCRRHDLSYDHSGTLATVHKTCINYGNTAIKPVVDKNVEGTYLERDVVCSKTLVYTFFFFFKLLFFPLFAGNSL